MGVEVSQEAADGALGDGAWRPEERVELARAEVAIRGQVFEDGSTGVCESKDVGSRHARHGSRGTREVGQGALRLDRNVPPDPRTWGILASPSSLPSEKDTGSQGWHVPTACTGEP